MPQATPSNGITAEVVGMTESEAVVAVEGEGMTARVISIDGESLPATMDYREDRVNLELEGGVVVAASIG